MTDSQDYSNISTFWTGGRDSITAKIIKNFFHYETIYGVYSAEISLRKSVWNGTSAARMNITVTIIYKNRNFTKKIPFIWREFSEILSLVIVGSPAVLAVPSRVFTFYNPHKPLYRRIEELVGLRNVLRGTEKVVEFLIRRFVAVVKSLPISTARIQSRYFLTFELL